MLCKSKRTAIARSCEVTSEDRPLTTPEVWTDGSQFSRIYSRLTSTNMHFCDILKRSIINSMSWPYLSQSVSIVAGYLRSFTANFGSLIWRLTVNFKAIWRLTVNPIETLFIAQSHRYREVTGSNPVEVLNFWDFYTRNSEIAFITAKIIAYLILSVSFFIYKSKRADGLD